MVHPEFLREFRDAHAREISRWPTSMEEVRRWAGSGTGFPVDVSVFRLWHAEPDVKPYVLCDGDALVGYGEVWVDEAEREVELGRIIVRPASRSRGVGRRFVRLLLQRAALSGLPDAFVRVVPDNHAAIACYRSAGFSPVSQSLREQYNRGQPVDYVWMHHPLRSDASGA
jgi:ribosomal protein S18 acetylase RimI-like enzyme